MRPDLEDFDELNDQEIGSRSRAMSWLVLGITLCGFITLAYYAYHSGSQSIHDGELTVVEADATPIRTVPTDRQGEQFPNKDKTIYEAIAADDAGKSGAHTEKLLPESEQVMPPESAEPTTADDTKKTTTFVNAADSGVQAESLQDDAPPPVAAAKPPIAPLDKPVKAAPPPAAIASAAIRASDFDKKQPPTPSPAAQVAAEISASEEAPSAAAPTMVNVKPATAAAPPTSEAKDAKAAAAAAAEPTQAAKPTPAKPAIAATGSGAYQVQLGAFKSEADAMAQWTKIRAKHGDVLSGTPIVVKAALPNGTFYRLRAAGFASADAAKAACATLTSRKQACFPAGK